MKAISWRTAAPALLLVVALMTGTAYALVHSEAESKAALRQQLHRRAQLAGRFTISALLGPSQQQTAASFFAGPAKSIPSEIAAFQTGAPAPIVVVLDSTGKVLGADPRSLRDDRQLLRTHPEVRAALLGRAGVSSLFTVHGTEQIFDLAMPFSTRHGTRVLILGADVSAIQGGIGGYMPVASDVPGGVAYLLDAHGRILASSRARPAGTVLPDHQLGAALAHAGEGTYADRTFVSAEAGTTSWRMVFSVPTRTLYSAVTGSSRTSAWALFAAFVAALICLLGVGAAALSRSARLAHERLHDPLTGLPNRALFQDRADRALAGVEAGELYAALLFIDLDHFKPINDSLGHAAGDELLQEVARRLRALTRWIDSISRLGGDEFLILCEQLESPEIVERIAARIQDSLSHPMTVGSEQVRISCSIGIALYSPGQPRMNVAELVHAADLAMYVAKRAGGGRTHLADAAQIAAGGRSPDGVEPLREPVVGVVSL